MLKIHNSCHSTIKFLAKYSLDKVNILDVELIRCRNPLRGDVYIKYTDTHHYLESSCYHLYYSKKSLLYSQAHHFNRIYSESKFFDDSCSQLMCWLKDSGYNEKVVRQQILKARKFTVIDLLSQDPSTSGGYKFIFNFTYYPGYSKLKTYIKY